MAFGAILVSALSFLSYSRFANAARNAAPADPPAISISQAPADLSLAREIDRAIAESDAGRTRWGVFVISVNDGRVLYSHNGENLFTPASNMKIFTTAVALDLLGPDYRWRTSAYAQAQLDGSGAIEGDLILYGRGA